jgi:hypothetical protein
MSDSSNSDQKMKGRASAVLPWLILLVIVVMSVMGVLRWGEHINQGAELNKNPAPKEEFQANGFKKILSEEPSAPSFIGTSDQLKQTVILPTLETPIRAGKSAIWCATTNLAWKELHNLAGGDVTIGNQGELSRQLNQSIGLNPGLEAKDYYAKAGLISQGIYQQIRSDLAAKGFTKIKPPEPDQSGEEGVVTFACLQVAMKWVEAFLNDSEPLKFRDSQGNKTNVKSFGIRTLVGTELDLTRRQVHPFFHDGQGHYAVDVSTEMKPYQVIVACVERGSNLNATMADFDRRVKEANENKNKSFVFTGDSILSIPNMEWEINHTFNEMATNSLSGGKLPKPLGIVRANQSMRLKMDRTGFEIVVENETSSITDGDEIHHHPSNHFVFDHPYLLMIRRRDESSPFFVMWVDNAELLQKR